MNNDNNNPSLYWVLLNELVTRSQRRRNFTLTIIVGCEVSQRRGKFNQPSVSHEPHSGRCSARKKDLDL